VYSSFSELPRTLYCAVYYCGGKKRFAIKITDPSMPNDKDSVHRRGVRMWNEYNVCIIGTLKFISTFTKRAVLHFSETIPSDNVYLHYLH